MSHSSTFTCSSCSLWAKPTDEREHSEEAEGYGGANSGLTAETLDLCLSTPTPLHEYSILTVSHVHLSQVVVICDDCKRLIPRADAIQQSGLIFCYSKEDCCKHIVSNGGRGCRRNKP